MIPNTLHIRSINFQNKGGQNKMSYYAIDYTNELAHHGILGMKWGVRRFQNEDGSLTSAGKARYYGYGPKADKQRYYRQKGAARQYKDVLKSVGKDYSKTQKLLGKSAKAYRTWVKEDPRNRTGQRAQYELERAQKMLGGKKGYADAKYAYEHKNLAKFVNRDGSLTTQGKLKYWDTNAARGKARMQRDIERDKNSLPTSEKARKNWLRTSDARGLANLGIANRSAAIGALIGAPKDPTKALRKNAKDIVKYGTKSVVRTALGNPIGGALAGAKMVKATTFGTAKALNKSARTMAGNSIRSGLATTYLTKNYATVPGMVKQTGRNAAGLVKTNRANYSIRDKALLPGPVTGRKYTYQTLEKTASQQKKALNRANEASTKVANTAKSAYSKVTTKKKKRS